jgi:hypothetical protein
MFPIKKKFIQYIRYKIINVFTSLSYIIIICWLIDFVMIVWGLFEYFGVKYIQNPPINISNINISNINITACEKVINSNIGQFINISVLIQILILLCITLFIIYQTCKQLLD